MKRGSYQYPDELNAQEKKDMDENPFLLIGFIVLMFFLLCWWAA